MFATDNDDDNRAAVLVVEESSLRLAGVAVYGPRNAVDRACKGPSLHA
jgi:hypothetical protein